MKSLREFLYFLKKNSTAILQQYFLGRKNETYSPIVILTVSAFLSASLQTVIFFMSITSLGFECSI